MAQIYCANCGKINEDTSNFCAHCGAAMARPKQKAQVDPEMAKKIKKFKRKRIGGRKFRMICVPVAIVSGLLTRFVGMPISMAMTWVFAPIYIVSVFPAVVGVVDCIRWLFGRRGDRSVERLEELGLLPLLMQEMEHGEKAPFGDKAWMSDHFIFGRKGKGVIVAMDDVLWVYTTYFKHHYTLKVGTKTMGVTQIFGTGIPARFNRGYKQQLVQIGEDLEKRNPNVLIDYSAENRAKYESLREK